MSKLQITIHENDIYTVDEKEQKIGVSDQCSALFGSHGAEQAKEAVEGLIKDLHKYHIDINYSKDPAPVKEDTLFSNEQTKVVTQLLSNNKVVEEQVKELPRQKMHTTSYR